ncbi:MAG: 5'/3'-nucleotidase SurE [Planctomycetota bacterium]
MNILLTNDDGADSPGLLALQKELHKFGRVTTIAPLHQHSAVSHSISIFKPLFVHKTSYFGAKNHYSLILDGTPADCVKIALCKFMNKFPDIVVSGVNDGANVGGDIFYSGTVAAALEASLWGINSFAVSLEKSPRGKSNFPAAARKAVSVIKSLLSAKLPNGSMFNINLPRSRLTPLMAGRDGTGVLRVKGIKFTHQDLTITRDEFIHSTDPRGRSYYWMKSGPEATWQKKRKTENTLVLSVPSDIKTLRAGYISVTPLLADFTDNQFLANHPQIW